MKPNIEVVPTALDRLHDALDVIGELTKKCEAIVQKMAALAPIEAAVAIAQQELQVVLDRDAEALSVWVNEGGKGTPPEPNAKQRELAARKLSEARAQLATAGAVKSQLEAERASAASELSRQHEALARVQIDVVGEEAIRSVSHMRKAAAAYLEADYQYRYVMQFLMSRSGPFGSDSPLNVMVGRWVERISKETDLSDAEQAEISRRAQDQTNERLDALMKGQSPRK